MNPAYREVIIKTSHLLYRSSLDGTGCAPFGNPLDTGDPASDQLSHCGGLALSLQLHKYKSIGNHNNDAVSRKAAHIELTLYDEIACRQLAIFEVLQGPFQEPFYQCVTYGFYTQEWQEQFYSIFSLLTM